MTINVLGTEYNFIRDDLNNPLLAENDGVCLLYKKDMIVRKKEYLPGETDEEKEMREKHVIIHELVHAFAEESGVQYGNDESLVDWIAHIIPKVNKCYGEIHKNRKEELL